MYRGHWVGHGIGHPAYIQWGWLAGEGRGRVLGRAGVHLHHRSLWKLGKLACREGTQEWGQAAQTIMAHGSLVHAPQ